MSGNNKGKYSGTNNQTNNGMCELLNADHAVSGGDETKYIPRRIDVL